MAWGRGTARRWCPCRDRDCRSPSGGSAWSCAGSAPRPALCELLGADSGVADALADLTREAKVKAWWEPYRDLLIGNYIPFETAATEVNEFQLEVAPGLLQIAPYIGAMMRAARLGAPEDEIERHVQLRLDRQAVLRPPGRTRTHLPRPEP